MASITVVCGVRMIAGFALRDTVIVTTDAGSNHLGMINGTGLNRRKWDWPRLMAGVTGVGGINVISRFTDCHCSVVTTETGANDLCMIYCVRRDGCPGCREDIMASIAGVRGIDMIATLAAGGGAVMTGEAIVHKTGVVHRRDLQPVRGVMAVITFQCRLNMAYPFALRNDIVMTT